MSWENYEKEVEESKGILETGKRYNWEIVDITLKEGVVVGGKSMRPMYDVYKGKTLEDVPIAVRDEIKDFTANYLNIKVMETDGSGATITMSFNVNKMNINEKNPQFESKIITFVRNLGHNIEPKTKIRLGNYLNNGLKFSAQVIPQKKSDGTDSGFHQIDVMSVKSIEGSVKKPQTNAPQPSANSDVKAKIIGTIVNCKSKDEAVKAIVDNPDVKMYLGQFLTMVGSGEIKFENGVVKF